MAYPPYYDPETDFSDAGLTVDPEKLDRELQLIRGSLNPLNANVQVIQRMDTLLANASVHPQSLTSDTLAAIGQSQWPYRGKYTSGVQYNVADMFTHPLQGATQDVLYFVTTAFTATDFDSDLNNFVTFSGAEILILIYAELLIANSFTNNTYAGAWTQVKAYYDNLSEAIPANILVLGDNNGQPYRLTGPDPTIDPEVDGGTNWSPVSSINLAGAANYLSLVAGVLNQNAIDLAHAPNVTNALPIANGGTGAATAAAAIVALGGLPLVGGTMTGPTIFADQLLIRPQFQDVSEKTVFLGAGGGTRILNMEDANIFHLEVSTSQNTIQIDNPPPQGTTGYVIVYVTNGQSQGEFLDPAGTMYVGGVKPALTVSGLDRLIYTVWDTGSGIAYELSTALDIKAP